VSLLILAIQLYLFETVLGAVLDGQRGILPGSFFVSLALTAVALLLAFKASGMGSDARK
jgi:predicted Co/Zn/Cd cation transporter (cation efflux family)